MPFSLIPDQHRIVWSRMPGLAPSVPASIEGQIDKEAQEEQLSDLSDGFWFRATLAITKAVRNDLLVAGHLTFDLARDGLVLQMMLRDREKGTNIHREGGWGNGILSELNWRTADADAAEVLGLIRRCCTLFDELASQLSATYRPRHARLAEVIGQAVGHCERRRTDGRKNSKC